MRYGFLLSILLFASVTAMAQKVTIDPTISPALFQHNTTITVTYDVTGTSLASLSTAWAWVWIPGAQVNAKYNFNPANSNTAQTDNAKFIKSVEAGRTIFRLTFKPSDFFSSGITAFDQMGILLKGNDWANGQTSDFLADFWDGQFQVKLTAPALPLFVVNGETINIAAETPVSANYELFINDVSVDTEAGILNYTYSHTVTETSGYATVKLVATAGANSDDVTFQYILSSNSPVQARPAGIISGINYHTDPTKVTLCLLAPGKSSCYAVGDFSEWNVLPQYQMKRDGEYFWIEISGLTSGVEYGFQYLLNESLYLADPYADKVLDPDDSWIPEASYPDLKEYPEEALHTDWYFNRVSVFQPGQQPYVWQHANYNRPEKEKLVVYELLIRDFFDSEHRNYQALIDTIAYIKNLGANAIELMPIMEYNGNESWGYNPTFMFAPDKYYGTKNKLKEFVDVCHANGIAVILDIAMNHHDMPNPYVLMDFNFTTFKPTATNKWFNTDAKHPFNVFFDMNHESAYTKKYLDTVNYYWLNEFKVDGFRFDLSKGFTQVNNPTDVGAWSAYDASRVSLLKRMADKIWSHSPEAYVILEHLSVNAEEKELAEYRAGEGKGMMLWGKMTEPYNQLTMGFVENADISGVYHTSRGWSAPHLVSYMESHDEERLMVKNKNSGKIATGYDTRSKTISLKRMAAAATIFYTVPGPKMLWQFGELGYDFSINHCEDGTVNDGCRVSPKPVKWDYRDDADRYALYTHIADLNRLRSSYDVFTEGTATMSPGGSLIKVLTLKNSPYTATPATAQDMNVVVAVNFDVASQSPAIPFPHTGRWYRYYEGGTSIDVAGETATVTMSPGEYMLFTDYPIESPFVTGIGEEGSDAALNVFPNPATQSISIDSNEAVLSFQMYTQQAQAFHPARLQDNLWDVRHIPAGFYVGVVKTKIGVKRVKIIKK